MKKSYCAAEPSRDERPPAESEPLEDPDDFVSPEDDCSSAFFLALILSLFGVALRSSLDEPEGDMLVLPVPLPAAPVLPAPLLLLPSEEPNPLEPAVSPPEETLD